jgi:hypothetical protein
LNVYSGYGGLKAQSQFVEETLLLERIGGRANRRRPTYRHFVEEGLLREIQSPWEMIQWQTVLGTGGYGMRARDVAMRLVWEQCGMSLREIGDFFGGLNYAAAAQRLGRLTS